MSPEQITSLRWKIDDRDSAAYVFDDPTLTAVFSEVGGSSLNKAAVELWRRKAAYYGALVDTTEGDSTRSLTALQRQALAMVTQYQQAVKDEQTPLDSDGRSYARVHKIVRP